jgi:N4-gp56 family major capsid protein
MHEKLNLHLFDQDTQTTLLNAPGNDLSAEMKTYYEKRLLDAAEPELVHDQFADKYPIPQGSGKTIEFRKYSALPKSLTALTEGTTPPGSKLNVSAVTATVSQYGDWIGMSDMLEMTAIDRNVEQATRLLGASAGRTLDTITREVLCGGTYVDWAGYTQDGTYHPTSGRAQITPQCVLTPDMVFKAAAELKSQNAKPIDDSFVAIVHPYVAYDLMRSEEWIDAHKYAAPENLYAGEIGKLAGVRFVETTEAKVVAPEPICGILKNRMTLHTALNTTGSADIVVDCAITESEAATITAAISSGASYQIYVGGTACTVTAVTAGEIGTAKITVSEAVKDKEAGAMVCGYGAGADGSAVFITLFLGQNAYGTTEIEGGGLTHIVKQLGYGDDPLNQRSSVGWKATKAVRRLCEEYMYRFESGSSYSLSAQSN